MDFTRRLFLQATAAAGALASFPTLAAARYSSGDEAARFIPPAGSVDCHMHLYNDRYPAAPGATLLPPNATLADYAQVQQRLHLQRFVIVTPSTYGTDNRCLLDGLRESNGKARGVAVIAADISDAELEQMNTAGVRGVRFNLSYGGASLDDLEPLAHRVNELGWHVQVVAPGTQLLDLEPRLAKLPARLVIDHMGHVPQPDGVNAPAFATINRLLAGDRTWVKLSGPYIRSNVGAPDYLDVGSVAKALVTARPDRMLWGSDWPHPTVALQSKPNDAHILDLFAQWAPREADRNAILRDNPASLYGF